jgi:tripartite-type tricarboxylate transporter receptor subunit TctC
LRPQPPAYFWIAMQLSRRRSLRLAAAAAALASMSRMGWAQAYPTHPVTMIVPVPAGGQMDSIARILARRMRAPLKEPVVIENVTGASGTIGVGRAVRAAPNGYTLCYGAWATHVINGAVYALQYDLIGDFEPVALTSVTPWFIAARNGVPAKDLKGLVAWLQANPDQASAGTSGAGGPGHIGGVLFEQLSGTRFGFVPYRGVALAMQDLVSGQIDLMIADPASAMPQFRAGRIKLFAIMAHSRSPNAREIPTVDEAGLPGLYLAPWHAIWAPKGTPRPVIGKLNAAVTDALADPAVGRQLADLGSDVPPREQQTPDALAAFHKAEIEKWWPIVKAANIRAE